MSSPEYTAGSVEQHRTADGTYQPVPPVHALHNGDAIHAVELTLHRFDIDWADVAAKDACPSCLQLTGR